MDGGGTLRKVSSLVREQADRHSNYTGSPGNVRNVAF